MYVERYNETHDPPLYVPTLAGLDHEEVDDLLNVPPREDELPDAFIATGGHWLFSRPFRDRFIDSGIYRPYAPPGFLDSLPSRWRAVNDHHNLGFLAFGSWKLVYDLSFGDSPTLPRRWADLADPAFAGQVTIHGCDGSPGATALLQLLIEEGGSQALAAFARNVASVKHFSQILKGIDSHQTDRTPFNIIQGAAVAQIPSNKRAAIVDLEDGQILMPLSAMVHRDRFDVAHDALAYFYEREFRDVMARGAFTLVDEIDWSEKYAFPDWEAFVARDIDELADELKTAFNEAHATSDRTPVGAHGTT